MSKNTNKKELAILISLFGLLAVAGCGDRDPSDTKTAQTPGKIVGEPFGDRTKLNEERLFSRLAPTATGVNFTNPIDTDHPMKRLYHAGYACGGVAIGDVNGDKKPDLYLVSGTGENKLYLQTGNLEFTDGTDDAGVQGGDGVWGAGVSMVDIDNDRDLDIYVCNYDSPNLLYINDGKGNFVEQASEFGLDIVDSCMMTAFCDYDGDGDLDVYLLTNRYYREGGRPQQPPFNEIGGVPTVKSEFQKYYEMKMDGPQRFSLTEVGRPDRLLRNESTATAARFVLRTSLSR